MSANPILFMAEAVTLAHVVRLLHLAELLQEPRSSIHFATSEAYRSWIETRGMTFIPIRYQDSLSFQTKLENGKPIIEKGLLAEQVTEDIEILTKIRPRIVVGDFRLSLAISARIKKVPYLGIANVYWAQLTPDRVPLHQLAIFLKPFGLAFSETFLNLSRRLLVPPGLKFHAIGINAVRKRYHQSRYQSIADAYCDADWLGFADPAEAGLPNSSFDSRHTMLGPINGNVECPLPPWWNDLESDRPVIYVNLGSSGKNSIVPSLLEALSELPVQVAVGSVESTDLKLPTSGKARIFAAKVLPGKTLCERASVVVCNGGAPSTYQALQAGRPVIGVTRNMDQDLNMQNLASLPFVQTFSAFENPASQVASTVRHFLADSGATISAERFKEQLLAYDQRTLFEKAIEMTIKTHQNHAGAQA